MESLERLRKSAKIKLIIASLAVALPIILLVLLEVFRHDVSNFAVLTDLLIIRYVVFIAVELFLVYKIYTYVSIIKNDTYANKFLIKKNDERNVYIKMKTDSKTVEIILYALGIGLICTAFTERSIFYILLVVFACLIVTWLIIRLWYTKKY